MFLRLSSRLRLARIIGATIALTGLVLGVGANPGRAASSTLTILAGPQGPYVVNFTPFSQSNIPYSQGGLGLVYEPLLQFNILKPGVIYPWLAMSYAWSNGGRTLTFHTRTGVTWSDGTPFTSADVAYTFNLMNRFPALDVYGVNFTKATAPSPTTAVLTFAQPAYGQLFVISQVLIVPQHLWSHITNPVTYTNAKPVGTGPYLLQSFTTGNFTLVANPHYWQAGLPKIQTIQFPQYTSNTSADLALEQGSVDWATLFIPHYATTFLSRVPNSHIWLPPVGEVFMCMNLTKYPFNNVAVRRALAMALDRKTMATVGEQGFALAATSPTGLILPNWTSYLAPHDAALTETYDPAAAKAALEKVGFRPGSDGLLREPNGRPFKVRIAAPIPYTDFMTDSQLMVDELRAAGVDVSVDGVALNTWTSDYTDGTYDMTPCGTFFTDGPYDLYNQWLNSALTAPVGKAAVGNYERWQDTSTDALLHMYASTNNPAVQRKAIAGLEKIMVDQVPLLPLFYETSYGEYTTAHAVGWPGPSNPYQVNGPSTPWDEVVVLRLRPVS